MNIGEPHRKTSMSDEANICDITDRLKILRGASAPPVRIEPLTGDASTRTYYRAHHVDGSSAVVMVMPNPGAREEDDFLDIQRFLEGLGLPVPQVYEYYPEESIVLLEDLGDELLERVLDRASDAQRADLYRRAVDILVELRRRTDAADPADSRCAAFVRAFDEAKLMWEMDFFCSHFVRGLCNIEPSAAAAATLREFFHTICGLLAAEPTVFAHRDYHARNLLIHRGDLVMIDFQDARMGPAQYDLASLLRDSYVSLPAALVDELIDRYRSAADPPGDPSAERFRFVFDVMSLQRNIKALGTFGFQTSVKGNSRYLSSIPRTAGYIAENIEKYPQFGPYVSVIQELIVNPAMKIEIGDRLRSLDE